MFDSRIRRARTCAAALGLVLGCGPSTAVPSADGTDTGTADGTTPVGGSEIPPGGTTGGAVTTGTTAAMDPSGSGSGSDTGSVDTTGGGLWSCGPRTELFGARVSLATDLEPRPVSIDASCTIDAIVARDRSHAEHVLSCAEPGGTVARTIEIDADPPVDLGLSVGDTVGLRVELDPGIDTPGIDHVALRDDDGELVAATYGSLEAPDGFDPAAFFQPFSFEFTADVCRAEPYERPEGGNFIDDPCPEQQERGAFVVTSLAGEAVLYEGMRTMMGEHDVRVVFARHVIPQVNDCGGPRDIVRIVFLRDG